jgi:hypothetical protein
MSERETTQVLTPFKHRGLYIDAHRLHELQP